MRSTGQPRHAYISNARCQIQSHMWMCTCVPVCLVPGRKHRIGSYILAADAKDIERSRRRDSAPGRGGCVVRIGGRASHRVCVHIHAYTPHSCLAFGEYAAHLLSLSMWCGFGDIAGDLTGVKRIPSHAGRLPNFLASDHLLSRAVSPIADARDD
jgi:hypothetical protein